MTVIPASERESPGQDTRLESVPYLPKSPPRDEFFNGLFRLEDTRYAFIYEIDFFDRQPTCQPCESRCR